MANLNLASVLIRPLGIHDLPSEDWKQAISQLLLLSWVELAISANYLRDYFGLYSKTGRSWVKCSWKRTEEESPLYTCPDADTLQPATSLTTPIPLKQHDRKQPSTCSDSSLHLKPATDDKSWLSMKKILWRHLVFGAEKLSCWVRISPRQHWEHELSPAAACLLNNSWHPTAGWYLLGMLVDLGTEKEFFLPTPAHYSPLPPHAAVTPETGDIWRVIEQTPFLTEEQVSGV